MDYFLQAVLAVVASVAINLALSYGPDALLKAAGVMPRKGLPKKGSEGLVWGVITYRTIAIVVSSFALAKLAPSNPMVYVAVLAVVGTLASIGGVLNPKTKDLAPAWYGWALVVVGLPASILGGLLAL